MLKTGQVSKYLFWGLTLILSTSCEVPSEEPELIISFVPSVVDFGRVEVDLLQDTSVVLVVDPVSTVSYQGRFSIQGGGFAIIGPDTVEVHPGDSQSVQLQFQPDTIAPFSGSLALLPTPFGEGPVTLPLSGDGVGQVQFFISDSTLDFGFEETGSTVEKLLTVHNYIRSGKGLKVRLVLSGEDFKLEETDTEFELEPGEGRIVAVRIIIGTANEYTATLAIYHSAGSITSPLEVPLIAHRDRSLESQALSGAGWEHFTNQEYSAAKLSFSELLDITAGLAFYDSLEAEGECGRGWARAFLREYEGSADDFKAGLDHLRLGDETRLNTLAGLAVVSQTLNRFQEAIDYGTALLALEPGYAFQYDHRINYQRIGLILVQSYYSIGDFTNAAAQIDLLDPDNAPHSSDPEELLSAIQAFASRILSA